MVPRAARDVPAACVVAGRFFEATPRPAFCPRGWVARVEGLYTCWMIWSCSMLYVRCPNVSVYLSYFCVGWVPPRVMFCTRYVCCLEGVSTKVGDIKRTTVINLRFYEFRFYFFTTGGGFPVAGWYKLGRARRKQNGWTGFPRRFSRINQNLQFWQVISTTSNY